MRILVALTAAMLATTPLLGCGGPRQNRGPVSPIGN